MANTISISADDSFGLLPFPVMVKIADTARYTTWKWENSSVRNDTKIQKLKSELVKWNEVIGAVMIHERFEREGIRLVKRNMF